MSLLQECRRLLLSIPIPPALSRRWHEANGAVHDYMPLDSLSEASEPPGSGHAKSPKTWPWSPRRVVAVSLAIAVVLALALGLGLGLGLKKDEDDGPGPSLHLGYANYTGSYLSNGVSQYLGMRYARPPTGDLRWRAPVKPDHEEEPQRAREFGPLCHGISESPDGNHDEDCLFVNVWGPTNATADMKLPVVVFIQGGGYTRLSNANWNGSQLVETSGNELVFVNFNYRVGLWGFLAGEEVRADGDLNAGLLDQRFVFKWIQEHISKFGGDPDHVVIHGISAGAGSVALHLAAYGGRDDNLFIGAISESIFIPAHPLVSDLEYQFNRTTDEAGCSDAESRMECLRGKSMNELQGLNVPSPFPGRSFDPLFYWTPCVDGDFLEDYPSSLYENNKFLRVPSLFGTCTNEGTVFTPAMTSTPSSFISFIQDQYPNLTTTQADNLLDYYPMGRSVPDHGSWFSSASRAYGEATFICPTNNILDAMYNSFDASSNSSSNPSLYSYRYNVYDKEAADSGRGVSHVSEAPAVFGPDMLTHSTPESYHTYNTDIVPIVMNYFVSFARSLNPNTHKADNAPDWEVWGEKRRRMVLETQNSTMERVSEGELERCGFWKGVEAATNQK